MVAVELVASRGPGAGAGAPLHLPLLGRRMLARVLMGAAVLVSPPLSLAVAALALALARGLGLVSALVPALVPVRADRIAGSCWWRT